jgi:outer membrane receptor protein involved in Fe transport
LSFTVAANYDFSDKIAVGVSTTGQTSSIDDGGREYPGGAVVNATAKYSLLKNVELSLSAYNLFDKFDLRGNGGVVNSGVNPAVISGNPALGRTVTAAIRYTF